MQSNGDFAIRGGAVWLEHAVARGYAPAYPVCAEQSGASTAKLEAITVPALFLTGTEDPNSTAAMSETMAAATPNGKACVVSGAAHRLTVTRFDEVSSVLSEFCAG